MCGKCKVYMAKQTDLDCSGCKISMFCSRKDKQEGQACETDLCHTLVGYCAFVGCCAWPGRGWMGILGHIAVLGFVFSCYQVVETGFQ